MKIHFSTKLISLLFVFVLIICSNNVFAFRAPDGDVAAIDENDKNMNSGPSARGSGEKPVQVDNNVPGLKSCLYRNLNRTFTGNEGLAAVDVLKDILQDYNSQTVERRIHKDNLGFKHIRLTQEYLGIPIVGGEITVHINQKDVIYQVNGKYLPNINISVQPSFNAFDASQIGSTDHIDKTGLRVSREPSLVIYGTNLAYYFIISYDGPEAGEWWYYVDANTGKVLQKYNNIQYAAPGSGANATVQGNRLTGEDGSNVAMTGWKETSGNYFLHNPGNDWQIYDVDAFDWEQLTTSSWGTADRAAVSCGNNYEDTQSWVSSVLLRNSFDNAGAMARANVHEGTNYVNAYWLPSQQQFYFGDGDGTTSNALTVLDVAAHEFGHAVTQFTSNLVYSYESGALNESYSDIMGCAVEFATQTDGRGSYPTHTAGRSDWLLAEDCWVSREALRDMRDPQRFNQPSYYKGTNWYSGSGDNGGVHTNSGVQNFAFYLLSEGGTGSNGGHAYNITGIGIANAAAVAMRANMVYLVSNSQYSDSRSAWVSAATDLGYPAATVGAVWDACGVFGSGGGECTLDPKFNQTSWSVGSTYYTDRAYTITGVSNTDDLTCLEAIIKTPNNDRNNTQSSGYMKFEMPFDGYVDIAFDSRLTSLPTWASDYIKWTGHTISTSLSSQPHMQMYYKDFSAGDCVGLGGNKAAGASTGTSSNYVVFLEDFNCDPPPPSACTLDPKFVQDLANNGSTYYTDRLYTITDAGPFAGMVMIKTPNADRNSTMSSDYLNEEYDEVGSTYYYVAYDRRASTPPNWLTSTFTKIPCAKIHTSLSSQGWLDVYKREVSNGECVNLGGNKGPGFSGGSVSNYIVLHSQTNIGDQCGGGECTLDPKFNQTYSWGLGSTYYTDRAYTITNVSDPDDLTCLAAIIKTPNNDTSNTQSSGYMKFEMPFDGYVYIAFDSRLTSLPTWASDFIQWTGHTISASLSSQPHMQLYYKEFSAGDCVDLGGNKGPGASTGSTSNYVVFLEDFNCDPGPPQCTLASKFNKVAFTGVGQTYYTDRAYTITGDTLGTIEDWIIKTPNDDRNNTQSSGYMKFEMPFDGYVDIAFDSRLTNLPAWASGLIKEDGWEVYTSLSSQPFMQIYSMSVLQGECVDLGGNKASGASTGTASNYIVFLDD